MTGYPVVLVSIACGFPKSDLFCLKWLLKLASLHTTKTVIQPHTIQVFAKLNLYSILKSGSLDNAIREFSLV